MSLSVNCLRPPSWLDPWTEPQPHLRIVLWDELVAQSMCRAHNRVAEQTLAIPGSCRSVAVPDSSTWGQKGPGFAMSSVEVQSTPNPNARKFILPAELFEAPLSFAGVEAAAAHPLATRLFALGTIYNVFMVKNFITVNKLPAADWDPLAEQIRLLIEDHFELS